MEKLEELAEEGFEVVKKFFRIIVDVPMNAFVYTVLFLLACVGWLSRHLTKRPPDALRSDNVRNIRPSKYAPGNKRGKTARR